MLEELCGGYKEVYQYLLAWMADGLCNIGPCGIAVVLRGPERSGKTFWAKEYMSLFGVHAITLDGPQQLVGNFNYHLLYQMVVLADEAFFAGNRAHAAKLRTIITRDDQFVTPKGVDGFTAPKMWRLIIASNDRRVVHASATDRRFLVLQVDAGRRNQDQEYFGRIDEEMRCGGRRALFEWLTGAWWRARAEGFARMVRPTPSLTFRPRATLKFGTNTRPERIDAQAHTDAKRDVITAASARGVRFCGNVVLHGIARRKNSEERVKHGANTVLGAFNRFLQEANDHDLCCLDRLPIAHPDSYLRDKFQIGLTFPSGQRRALDRIMAFSIVRWRITLRVGRRRGAGVFPVLR